MAEIPCPICRNGVTADPKVTTKLAECWLCGGYGAVDPDRVCKCGLPANEMKLEHKAIIHVCGRWDCK